MLFDTHAHLDDRAFDPDREELLDALPRAGLALVMNPGCSLTSSLAAAALASRRDYLYAAVGSHPDAADEVCAEVLEQYRTLCRDNPKVRAIGEIGLDYHYEDVPRAVQQRAFRAQLELARELKLPVIIHDREAHEDALSILRDVPEVTGVFHCFSGSAEMARQLADKGWYIGFTGVLTFKNARRAVEAAAALPLDRIVLETDCPYMAPEPVRGIRCDSSLIRYVGEYAASVKGISPEEVFRQTAQNARTVYQL